MVRAFNQQGPPQEELHETHEHAGEFKEP